MQVLAVLVHNSWQKVSDPLMTSDPKSVNTLLALTNDDAYVQVALLCCVIRWQKKHFTGIWSQTGEMTSDPKSVNTLWALNNVDACVHVAWLCCVIRGRSSILHVFGPDRK